MEWLILGLLHWLHFYLVTGLDPWLIRWLMYHISWTTPVWYSCSLFTQVSFLIASTLSFWWLEGAWWTYFKWFRLLSTCVLLYYIRFMLCAQPFPLYQPPFRGDVRFMSSIPVYVRLQSGWLRLRCHRSCKRLHSFMLYQRAQRHQSPEPLQYPEDQYTSRQGWYDAQEDIWYDALDCTEDELEDDDIWYDARDGTEDEASCVAREDRQRAFQQLLHMLRPVRSPTSEVLLTSAHLLSYVATVKLLEDIAEHKHGRRYKVVGGAFLAGDQRHGDVPIVIDSGTSFSVTPYESDFPNGITPCAETEMIGLSDTVNINGVGWAEWPIRDIFGHVVLFRTKAYHIPKARVRLFSTQSYFQENSKGSRHPKAYMRQDHEKVTIVTPLGEELVFNYQPHSNLPLMFLDFCTNQAGLTGQQVYELTTGPDLERIITLLNDNNYNLSNSQKELLLWHSRLGHAGFARIQDLMRGKKNNYGDYKDPPIIETKTAASRCEPPKCPACQLSKQHRRSPGSQHVRARPEHEMAIRRENMIPGECFSVDQFTSTTPGRLPHTRGKERQDIQYNGGTLYIDHATGFTFIRNQISLRAGETLLGKHALERFANQFGVQVQNYHADNHPFGSHKFREDCALQEQGLTFSGVGAHFQNGVAERGVQTITSWALALMMHQMIHWPACFDAALWPFAMEHAVELWNHMPHQRGGLTPLEQFTGTKSFSYDVIQRARVWGCPVYVLDPKLQDGKKLPKWSKRSRLGMYLGASTTHSSTVGRILNLKTGHISPQYHVVYDELFTSVQGELIDQVFDARHWQELIEFGGEERLLDPTDAADGRVPFTEFYDDFVPDLDQSDDDSSVSSETSVSEGEDDENDDFSIKVEETSVSDEAEVPVFRTRSGRQVKSNPKYAATYYSQPRPQSCSSSFAPHQTHQYLAHGKACQKIPARSLLSSFIHGLSWQPSLDGCRSFDSKRAYAHLLHEYDADEGTLEDWEPLALAAKANDADLPTWEQAMNGPDREGFWEACRKEVETLRNMNVWDEVTRQPWMNVLPSTWAFRIKRYPDGLVRKLKSRFCVRGDRQIEGVDFFDTYAPVVHWNTVRLLLILAAQLGLSTKQVDFTAAFVHADIDLPPGFHKMSKEEQARQGVYVEMPRGFAEPGKVLKLKKNLYGLKQAPRNWVAHLSKNLAEAGFEPAIEVDPCLYISDKVICIAYVDDCCMLAAEMSDIDQVLQKLRKLNMQLEEEDDIAGFLGVHIERTHDRVKLTQKGLTQRIIDALQVNDLPAVDTPADRVLGKDEDGDPPNCAFNYASVIGMLWYLYGHSRPDLGLAVSQAARFAFAPKRSHELALIRIGQYLKGTIDEGLIMKPMNTKSFKMDAYVDSDFLGLYGKERRSDPDNVKSRTGYVICLNDCPIVWSSKLQESIALSTMMAEYYALSTAMREVIPLRTLVKTVANGCGLSSDCLTTFMTTVWEDNVGALTLANLDPGQNTPRSKFYDSKVHWFRSHLSDEVVVKKIDTKLQLADLFTKPLPRETFTHLRALLMGW
jgi:hypothetical protein